jgi:hypothetical protein
MEGGMTESNEKGCLWEFLIINGVVMLIIPGVGCAGYGLFAVGDSFFARGRRGPYWELGVDFGLISLVFGLILSAFGIWLVVIARKGRGHDGIN